jgi:hypothetical protein
MTNKELYETRGFEARKSGEFKTAAEAFRERVLRADHGNIDVQAAFARGWRRAEPIKDTAVNQLQEIDGLLLDMHWAACRMRRAAREPIKDTAASSLDEINQMLIEMWSTYKRPIVFPMDEY